jgi:hypothetical protein
MIKKNLAVASETIKKLREENLRVREMLSKEYQEKIQALEEEVVYMKYLLNRAKSSEPNKKLQQRLEKLQENCHKKDKIIEIQDKKLLEISSSVKNQVKEFKNIFEQNISLENELKKAKKLENPDFLQTFIDFFKFSKSLDHKILYKTAKSCLGSSSELSKDLKKHKCVKITKNLLKLCKKLMRFINYNKNFNLPTEDSSLDERNQAKTTNSTNFEEKIPAFSLENSLKSSPEVLSSKIPHLSSKLKKPFESQSRCSLIPIKSSPFAISHSKSQNSESSDKSFPPKIGEFSLNEAKEKLAPRKTLPEPQGPPSFPMQENNEDVFEDKSHSSIIPIAEEIPIFPKDYKNLYQEGEQLLKLIDSQNSRLSKLSKVFNEAYESPSPKEESQEISSRPSVEESQGNVESFQRKRSRWNTNNINTNLRIPFQFQDLGSEGHDQGKEELWSTDNFQGFRSDDDRDSRRSKKNVDLRKDVVLASSKKRNDSRVGKVCRNSPDRFHEYVRPNMKSEKNWDSVEEFFNSD